MPKLIDLVRAEGGDYHGAGVLEAAVLLADEGNAGQICNAAQQWQQKHGSRFRDLGKEVCEKVVGLVHGEEAARAYAAGEKDLDAILSAGE